MDQPADSTVQLSSSSLKSLASCPERYETKSLIGQGGMGMVFRAYDRELGRDVAIKVLLFEGSSEQESQQRFLREAKTLAILDHPNIVKIYSSGLNGQGNPYNVMEFLEGESLSHELSEGPALDAVRFFNLINQLVSGLEHAHKQQIVHRDLKPSNIMHCKNADGNDCYKIIDFGIARIDLNPEQHSKTLTRTDAILGSPLYMSPEQCRGARGDYRSDIYALGCIMYECIAGKPPFHGDSAFEIMYKQMSEDAPKLDSKTKSPEVIRLASLIERCLKKNADERPQSMTEVATELAAISSLPTAKFSQLFSSSASLKSQSIMPIFAGAVCLVAALLIGYICFFRPTAPAPTTESVEPAKKTKQERIAEDIKRLKMKTAAKKNDAWSINDPELRKDYLSNLFMLGRKELQSSSKHDIADAEKTYTEALLSCDKYGEEVDEFRPGSYALRAKAKAMQNNFSGAETDFDEAIKLAKTYSGKWCDILYERARQRVRARRFDDAFADFMEVHKIFVTYHRKDPIWINQELDSAGVTRMEMFANIDRELNKLKPDSEDEALKMLHLSNALTRSMIESPIKMTTDAARGLSFSESLMAKIKGHDELKNEINSLQDALIKRDNGGKKPQIYLIKD